MESPGSKLRRSGLNGSTILVQAPTLVAKLAVNNHWTELLD